MSTLSYNKRREHLRELIIFTMLGTVMFVSKMVMAALPNIHIVGALTMIYTIAYRRKALIPIYLFVLLDGLYSSFIVGWLPYLYIWAILWGITMLLPKKMPRTVACVVYPTVCAVYGFLFGILYAPGQALLFGMNFEQTVAWIITGIVSGYDPLHAVGNFAAGLLVYPLSVTLHKLSERGQK